jgi:phage-related protein
MKSLAEAMKSFMEPFVESIEKLATKIKTFNNLAESMGSNVAEVASKFKTFVPLVLGLSTALSGLAGLQVLQLIPVLNQFGFLFGRRGPIGLGIAAFIATSPVLRASFVDILMKLKPLVPALKQIGGALLIAAESVTKALENLRSCPGFGASSESGRPSCCWPRKAC